MPGSMPRRSLRPAPTPGRASISRDLEYQPVTVSGHFVNDREIHVVYTLTAPNGPVGGVGYLVMTPFVADAGWTVYVNRGFVPGAIGRTRVRGRKA